MKRPRRPMKRKVASKKVAPRKVKSRAKVKPQRAKAVPDATEEWAAVFDQPKPPTGWSYQWSQRERTEYMLSKGWTRVPYSRHADLPRNLNFDGYVVYEDNALFQISAELARAERERMKEMALDLTRDFDDSIQKPEGRGFYIMPPSFMVDSAYDRIPDNFPAIAVKLEITLMVPARWQDAASALKLEAGEYARRRVLMNGHMIRPDFDGTFSPFDLVPKKVD